MASRTRSARSGNYSRQASRQISYKEYDSTSDLEDEDLETDVVASGSNYLSSPSNTCTSRTSRLSSARRRALALRKKRNASHLGKNERSPTVKKSKRMSGQQEDVKEGSPVLPLEGTIPCWQHLPYHILASVFQYSCHLSKCAWNAWLVKIALLCKSFVEPALSALYYAPCFSPILRAQGLFDLLRSQTTNSWLDYRAKVKYLDLDLPRGTKRYAFDWSQILALTPQLRGIQVAAFKASGDLEIGQIFRALESNHMSLREWRWLAFSGMGSVRAPLNCIYPTSSMRTIERLTFIHHSHVEWGPENFAAVVNALPRLKHLRMYFSTSLTPEVLSLLSIDLESLQLLNCKLVTPDALTLFLAARGQKLRCLDLEGYSSYGLSFLANLARSCPLLQDLGGDFTSLLPDTALDPPELEMPRPHNVVNPPTWPSSLQRLKLLHLRRWTADVIFLSLLDSAASLPDLRHIIIKSSLGESGWKSRVRLREKWTAIFTHIFLRSSEPPNPHLRSLGAYQAFKRAQEKSAGKSVANDSQLASSEQSSMTPCKGSDQLSHTTIEPDREETDKEPDDDEVHQISGNRRSSRLSQNAGNSQRSSPKRSPPVRSRRRRRRRPKGSDSDFSSEDSALEDEFEEDLYAYTSELLESFHVQGLCDVVDLQFDNLRPSDEQLRESDFLNEEVSGDEDWRASGDDGDEWD